LRRAAAVCAVACLSALLGASDAAAKFFTLPAADVEVQIRPDGSLGVTEHITFLFSGPFEGAFREVPLREGERIDAMGVSEGDQRYAPGASAELGSTGAPGTFGTTSTGDGMRIVWHYRASNEQRTFTVSYRLVGLAVAHDDVVDVNLRVWGDEWQVGLDRLTAVMRLPGTATGPDYRVWGAPAHVQGVVTRDPNAAGLEALGVPAHQFVEERVLFPRALLTSTAGAKVEPGHALNEIVAEQD
jgi:hypothetical protein